MLGRICRSVKGRAGLTLHEDTLSKVECKGEVRFEKRGGWARTRANFWDAEAGGWSVVCDRESGLRGGPKEYVATYLAAIEADMPFLQLAVSKLRTKPDSRRRRTKKKGIKGQANVCSDVCCGGRSGP